MSLKTELEGLCKHPQGYFYVQDVHGNYLSPARFLVSLTPELLEARYGFRTSGGQKEYWIYKQGFLGAKEEFIFRTYVPEGRLGWATDFEHTPKSQTHYYAARNSEGMLLSLCGKHKRRDDDKALFILHPQPASLCKTCLKELNKAAKNV